MGRRSEARQRKREAKRDERRLMIGVGALVVAVVASFFTKDLWADAFDGLIGMLGDGSTAAAFVGWLAGFPLLIYIAVILLGTRSWPSALRRTWWLGVLLLIPFLSLMPSRTRRSASIENEYWYLGSFFDTYGVALLTIVLAGAAALFCLWWSTRGDTDDLERASRWARASVRIPGAVLIAGTVGTLVWAFVGF